MLGIFTAYTIYLACMWAKLNSDQKNSFHNDVGFFMGENFKNYEYTNPALYFNIALIIGTIGTVIQCSRSYCRSR